MLTSFKDHLFRSRNLQISIYTLFARKNKNTGNAIQSEYINSYNSRQYNGVPFLTNIENNGNHYISFSYNRPSQNQGEMPIQEEVMLSYPQLDVFNSWLGKIISDLSSEGMFDRMFQNNQVTQEFSNFAWQSPPLISNKIIQIVPATLQIPNSGNIELGFNIIVNSSDKYDFISASQFFSLITLLMEITSSHLTFRNQCVQAEMQAKSIENNQLIKGLLRSQNLPTDVSNHHLDERQQYRNNGPSNNNYNNNYQNNNNGYRSTNGYQSNNNSYRNNYNNQNGSFNNQFGNFQNQQSQNNSNNFGGNNQFGNFNNQQQQQNGFNNQNNNFQNQQPQNNENPFANYNGAEIDDDDIPFNNINNDQPPKQNNDRQIDKGNLFKNAETKKESGSMNDLSKSVNNEENSSNNSDNNGDGKSDELLSTFIKNGKEADDDISF